MSDMPDEIDLSKLPPRVRCLCLVGSYLQFWATMEARLNEALYSALGVDSLPGTVVARNIQLRDKLNILRALISIAPLSGEDNRTYSNTLKRIRDLSHDRNMVAHDMFMEDESGECVEFIVVKASGKIQFPQMKWSLGDFRQKTDELWAIHNSLDSLPNALQKGKLALAMAKTPPNSLLELLDSLNPLPHPSPEHLDLNPQDATHQTNPESSE